jgi:hypothetical protein
MRNSGTCRLVIIKISRIKAVINKTNEKKRGLVLPFPAVQGDLFSKQTNQKVMLFFS